MNRQFDQDKAARKSAEAMPIAKTAMTRGLVRYGDLMLAAPLALWGLIALGVPLQNAATWGSLWDSPAEALVMAPMFSAMMLGAALVIEALFIAVFGNTPGKWIAGLTLKDAGTGKRLNPWQSFQRNLDGFFTGFLGTVTPLAVVPHLLQALRVRAAGQNGYNRRAGVVVRHRNELSGLRVMGLISYIAAAFLLMDMAWVEMGIGASLTGVDSWAKGLLEAGA